MFVPPRISDPPLTRRRFLAFAAATAAAGAAGCDLGVPSLPGFPFTLGVASGDPLHDRVVLWTRLAPDPLAADGLGGMPNAAVPVYYEIANDEGFRSTVRVGGVMAYPELAHSVHVDVDGLEPGRWYHYRFWAPGYHTSPAGRTRTLPAPGDAPASFRMASATCQQYSNGHYTSHAALAAEDLDLVVFLGDYIYEGGNSGPVRSHGGPRIRDLAGYRNRYALYKSDPNLQESHRAFPWVVTWDDHEVSDNYAGDFSGSTAMETGTFLALRAAAYRAWYEHMPVRLPPPTDASLRIHRQLAIGNLAAIFVLDTRQYRTRQECGIGSEGIPCAGFPSPDGDMLGTEQEAWLLAGLGASTARWNVLAQQVQFSPKPLGSFLSFDAWDGYPLARERITSRLRAREERNTVILTGDLHASVVSWVPGTPPGPPSSYGDPVASEFLATGMSSGQLDPAAHAVLEIGYRSLPNMVNYEALWHGYVRHEIGREIWRADYRSVETVAEPTSPVFTSASFEVERGDLVPRRL